MLRGTESDGTGEPPALQLHASYFLGPYSCRSLEKAEVLVADSLALIDLSFFLPPGAIHHG
jgi:hypothetical protein